jgi:glycosyltransferase involved in cell wall biosynthesis
MSEERRHDPETICNSQVFKALNLLIDGKVEQLKWTMERIADPTRFTTKYGGEASIANRVAEEEGGRTEMPLPFQVQELKQIRRLIDDAERLDREVNDLQQFKLRLIGDWDFTRDDLREQIAVFGQP